ncbi:iron-containing redox enzyme family protein [Gluconacetobacter asukensis]|uniref:iron-containing redox enzyme family protein n=1 Tax=Gluconacetobacter asukensis TaxID=1017181 RepID=UPI0023DDBCB5|nr:iron-containing redox enzyme family protein [Gluconacetobacter asukensis]
MCWFLEQEAAGEAGFEDLTALVQVRMPIRPKLEPARNYWDEMGHGREPGMHGPMLAHLVHALGLEPRPDRTVWQSLALANTLAGLAFHRHLAVSCDRCAGCDRTDGVGQGGNGCRRAETFGRRAG